MCNDISRSLCACTNLKINRCITINMYKQCWLTCMYHQHVQTPLFLTHLQKSSHQPIPISLSYLQLPALRVCGLKRDPWDRCAPVGTSWCHQEFSSMEKVGWISHSKLMYGNVWVDDRAVKKWGNGGWESAPKQLDYPLVHSSASPL